MCELVDTYIINVIPKKYNKNDFRLYCDDELVVLKNKNGPESEQITKSI